MSPGASPGGPPLPPGRPVTLPGRGTVFVRERTGPVGAPAVVLLHGLSATADLNWFPSYSPLARHFRVIALDQRGHGQGIRGRRMFRLADCADDVAALAAELAIDRLIVVGYSMGGPIAQLVWHRHRDLVAGLVLCATSRNFAGTPRERVVFGAVAGLAPALRLTGAGVWRQAMRRIFAGREGDDAMREWAMAELRRNDPRTVIEAAAALGRFSSHTWIGEIDVPTAVVVTMRDQLVPPHRQLKLAAAIPGATVHEVDGDHGACVLSAHRFVPALVAACQDVAESSARR